MPSRLHLIGSSGSFDAFFRALGKFFDNLTSIDWATLAFALLSFLVYLTIRSRAYFHVIRAAYPHDRIQFRRIWGGYMTAYGFNNAIPGRSGDLIRMFLTKSSVHHSTYPAVVSSFFVELVFDFVIAVPILIYTFSQGVLPKLPDFAKLPAFDLAFFVDRPQLTMFLITVVAILGFVAFALLAERVQAFWANVRHGVVILSDHRRYLREVFAVQAVSWLFRFAAVWFFLEAFHVGGSVRNVVLVLGVQSIASFMPLAPGGAGIQQALLVKVFAGAAAGATIAAYSVGQQIAIGLFTFTLGFIALVTIFGFRSFKEVIHHGRADHKAHKASKGTDLAVP